MDEQPTEQLEQQESTSIPSQQAPQPAKNPNLHAALAYALGAITGIIFLLIEKENDYIRFHAAQSTIVFGILWIIGFIPVLNILSVLIWPITLILWVVLMYKAYQGERFALPVIGDLAEKLKQSI